MPLDTSIAMGVRPVEQPNMLAQMGQMMQLRQAQQGYEEQNALKQALSQGVDINDKATFNRLASINPKLAMDLRAKELESQKTNAEIGLKRADYLGGAYGGLVKNPTLDNARGILSNAVSLGILTPQHAEQQFATLSADPSKIAELAQKGVEATISAKEKMADATSRANNAATVGASMFGHRVTQQNNEFNQRNPTLTAIQGSYEIPDPNAPSGVRQVEGFGGFNTRTGTVTPAQIRAPAAAPTIANSLAALQPAPVANPNVNALNPNFITSAAPASPVVPSAAATAPSASAAIPSAGLPATAAQAGVFKPKPSPQAEKQAQTDIDRERGKVEVATIIGGLASKYTDLATTGGMTSTKKGTMENIGSYLANTALGQEAGKMTATQEQSLRNEIRAQSPVLLQGIKKATGMTAKEMDSNADVKRWMEAMGSTTFDVQSTLGILKSLNAQFGSGNEIPAAPAKTGNIASDPAIKTLIDKYSTK
jgi:hypothetical protein